MFWRKREEINKEREEKSINDSSVSKEGSYIWKLPVSNWALDPIVIHLTYSSITITKCIYKGIIHIHCVLIFFILHVSIHVDTEISLFTLPLLQLNYRYKLYEKFQFTPVFFFNPLMHHHHHDYYFFFHAPTSMNYIWWYYTFIILKTLGIYKKRIYLFRTPSIRKDWGE